MNKDYIDDIKNSIESKKYRNYFITRDNDKIDVLKDGRLSCAFFLSSVLFKFRMIKNIHATVRNTIKDMDDFGWKKIDLEDIRRGDVIVWEKKRQDDEKSRFHIGFYIGNKKAISNSWYKKSPWKHSYNYNGKRKILDVFTFFN
ncbi:MAG: peptidoglycan amidohydrolase family protein [Patescibacteria group bacterium]|nr:peptidoglycan amidohydrolase family protein [Patescibacteria group bacterium]MDD4303894.1 peptidoglycan amidohydrolase family protein [Patescibacteria group bacterium]MDD4695119.1 peptidoglycan amidohydrolase family protein [Patescibacteria group bacterium]